MLEARRWIDTSDDKRETARVLAGPAYLNVPAATIAPRLLGQYQDGMGRTWTDPDALAFHRGGAVNFPYLSNAMWFMTQHRRWGLVRHDPDYLAVAWRVNQVQLFREAAQMTDTPVPAALLRSSRLIDGSLWDGSDPAGYAASFSINNM